MTKQYTLDIELLQIDTQRSTTSSPIPIISGLFYGEYPYARMLASPDTIDRDGALKLTLNDFDKKLQGFYKRFSISRFSEKWIDNKALENLDSEQQMKDEYIRQENSFTPVKHLEKIILKMKKEHEQPNRFQFNTQATCFTDAVEQILSDWYSIGKIYPNFLQELKGNKKGTHYTRVIATLEKIQELNLRNQLKTLSRS